MYLDVTETANSPGDTPPLFGAPAVFGDTLDFDPTGFSAGASDGSTDLTDGQLTLGIMAQSGLVIDSLVVSESGDYSLLGFTPNSAGAGVASPLFIDIVEVDGITINPISFTTSLIIGPSDGDFWIGPDGVGFVNGIWSGSANVNIAQAVSDAGYDGGATKLSVSLNDTLFAYSSVEGSSSLIAKKDFKIGTVTIPEPSTLALVFVGLLAGLSPVRRRTKGA